VRRFKAPPGWPPPPNVRWRPPKRWGPDESWPPAPPGWAFWVNESGRRVAGPFGRYGGPSLLWPVAGAVLVVLMLIGAGQVFGGGDGNDAAAPAASTPTSGPPTVAPTDPGPDPSSATPDPGESTATSVSATPSATPDSQSTSPDPAASSASSTPVGPSTAPTDGGQVHYRNCGAVRAAGKDPLLRGQPGYEPRLDPDGDGVACGRGHD
jgi:hypothetical protein